MNFIEAVKRLKNDCYSQIYMQGDFHKRLHLVNDKLEYVEKQLYYDGSEADYIPTSNDMLADEWIVTGDEIVNGIRINDLKHKTIKNIEYIGCHFVFTLCNGKKYKFLGDICTGSSVVEIYEIAGN